MISSLDSSARPVLKIRPSSGWSALDLREVWQFRDLLTSLAGRDVKLRYRQTALGVLWVLFGPLLSAGIFSFIFNNLAGLATEGVPGFLFTYVGLLGFNVAGNTLIRTSGSLIGNQHLVSKVYFPRIILPLSSVFSTLVDFGVALMVTFGLMIHFRVALPLAALTLPLWLLLLLLFALGLGLISAALMVTYRDVGYALAPVTQFLQYACPVVYAVGLVPAKILPFYYLNPLASLIQGFRWSLIGTSAPPWGYVVYAACSVVGLFVAGAYLFSKMERRFADVI